jgi:hypothetical protein
MQQLVSSQKKKAYHKDVSRPDTSLPFQERCTLDQQRSKQDGRLLIHHLPVALT